MPTISDFYGIYILERELACLEQKYHVTSPEFYRQYQAGLTDDSVEVVGWIGRYKLYLSLKQTISDSLKLVLTERTPSLA
jgi:hypothetical protein